MNPSMQCGQIISDDQVRQCGVMSPPAELVKDFSGPSASKENAHLLHTSQTVLLDRCPTDRPH